MPFSLQVCYISLHLHVDSGVKWTVYFKG